MGMAPHAPSRWPLAISRDACLAERNNNRLPSVTSACLVARPPLTRGFQSRSKCSLISLSHVPPIAMVFQCRGHGASRAITRACADGRATSVTCSRAASGAGGRATSSANGRAASYADGGAPFGANGRAASCAGGRATCRATMPAPTALCHFHCQRPSAPTAMPLLFSRLGNLPFEVR